MAKKTNPMHTDIFSPTKKTFRAYYVEENYDSVIDAFEYMLKDFKYSDEIQVTIEAPAKNPPAPKNSTPKASSSGSGRKVVKGFAG